jgi:hypothetical protein
MVGKGKSFVSTNLGRRDPGGPVFEKLITGAFGVFIVVASIGSTEGTARLFAVTVCIVIVLVHFPTLILLAYAQVTENGIRFCRWRRWRDLSWHHIEQVSDVLFFPNWFTVVKLNHGGRFWRYILLDRSKISEVDRQGNVRVLKHTSAVLRQRLATAYKQQRL